MASSNINEYAQPNESERQLLLPHLNLLGTNTATRTDETYNKNNPTYGAQTQSLSDISKPSPQIAEVDEEAVGTDTDESGASNTSSRPARSYVWKTSFVLLFLGLFLLLVFLFDTGLRSRHPVSPSPPLTGQSQVVRGGPQPDPPLGLPEKITKRWGQYSPYLHAGTYEPPPRECIIDQVNILHRHGARYPDADDASLYARAISHLASARKFRDAKLEFLKNYEYTLPEEDLVPFGAEQSWQSGMEVFDRYAGMLGRGRQGGEQRGEEVYVRSTTKVRVLESAGNWTQGFAAASRHRINPPIAQRLSESFNNTLNDDCPAASIPNKQMDQWLDVFAPPIIKRLEGAAPGANLTKTDIHKLMAVCPFETIAQERPSRFCDLFQDAEFKSLEYYGDVEKYYRTGYGNSLGPVVGIGYVNELLARLTGRPPAWDSTTHNDSLPFPLDRPIYVDFSHENLMVGVFATMGLFDVRGTPPDPHKMDQDRMWIARRMVPFSARMVVERMLCRGSVVNGALRAPGRMKWKAMRQGQFLRVLVNDALQPLEFCGADEDGLCSLDDFVKSQKYARANGDGDFEKCYQ